MIKKEEESVLSRVEDECAECGLCTAECELLTHIGISPGEMVKKYRSDALNDVDVQSVFSCNLCGLCEEVCPVGINGGDMFLAMRRAFVKKGIGPLSEHERLLEQQRWVSSEAYRLVVPDRCERLFFPGCNLCGYSPDLVMKTFHFLSEKLPGTGIMLGCCGAPMRAIGMEADFEEFTVWIEDKMKEVGSSELIVSCPECFKTLKQGRTSLKLRFLSETLLSLGLPEPSDKRDHSFYIWDSCSARHEDEIRRSVRSVVLRSGFTLSHGDGPANTGCCGIGGMAFFVNPKLTSKVQKRILQDVKSDIVTYCASCRRAFAMRKPTLHYLDLIFNPYWKKQRLRFPDKDAVVKQNQEKVRILVLENQP